MTPLPKIGIYGLTGCAGDQLVILNCEAELLTLATLVDIRSFLMAGPQRDPGEVLDIAFVEGSVCQSEDIAKLKKIRERSKNLVALGTCAAWGGIAAMDRRTDRSLLRKTAKRKGAESETDSIVSQPLSAFVKVDFALNGCPIEKHQFLQLIASLLRDELPEFPKIPVCTECRMRENVCLIIEEGAVCCGPLTNAGCNARCPSYGRPCDGCHGPVDEAYFTTTTDLYKTHGVSRKEIQKRLKFFSAPAGMDKKILGEF